jgi:hypothetical protein
MSRAFCGSRGLGCVRHGRGKKRRGKGERGRIYSPPKWQSVGVYSKQWVLEQLYVQCNTKLDSVAAYRWVREGIQDSINNPILGNVEICQVGF